MKRRLFVIFSSVFASILMLTTTGHAAAPTSCAFNDPDGYEFCVDAADYYQCDWTLNYQWCVNKLPSWARANCRAISYCGQQYSDLACDTDYPVWGNSVVCYYEDV
jgi:hypothetical protein